MKGIDLLNQVGVSTKIIDLGKNEKDPDEFIKAHGAEAFKLKLKGSSGQVDYKIDEILSRYDLSIPDQKLHAADEMTTFLSTLFPEVQRDVYAGRAAEKMDIVKKSLLEDANRKAKMNEKKAKKEAQDKDIRDSMGYGDRVNTDKIRFSAAAATEEKILGILLSRPDLTAEAVKKLIPEDFVTSFGRLVYETFLPEFTEGKEAVLSKDGRLDTQQIGAVSRMIAQRAQFTDNGESTLNALIDVLKKENKKREYDKKIEENPVSALDEYIKRIKANRKEDT